MNTVNAVVETVWFHSGGRRVTLSGRVATISVVLLIGTPLV